MVNKIKNNSTQGLYIVEDDGASIAADTPGEIDLDLLVLGTKYIYFDNILGFNERGTANKESDDFVGFKTWNTANFKTQANTGGAYRIFYTITTETTETVAENLKLIFALNSVNNAVSGQGKIKYLVKQTATTSFEKFVNSAGVLKNATAVIIRGYDIVEKGTSGKDVKAITFACERITSRG